MMLFMRTRNDIRRQIALRNRWFAKFANWLLVDFKCVRQWTSNQEFSFSLFREREIDVHRAAHTTTVKLTK